MRSRPGEKSATQMRKAAIWLKKKIEERNFEKENNIEMLKMKISIYQTKTQQNQNNQTERISKMADKINKHYIRGWRDGSGVKSSCCSSRRPKMDPQHPHGSSQPSLTPDTLF